MDLRGLANSISNAVNPNMIVTVTPSTGFTIGAGAKQIPTYGPSVTGPAQLQALDGADLKQIDGLNLEGVIRAIYLRGALNGVVRTAGKGGDLVTIAPPSPAPYVGTWLVAKILETWPLWTKAVIVLQTN